MLFGGDYMRAQLDPQQLQWEGGWDDFTAGCVAVVGACPRSQPQRVIRRLFSDCDFMGPWGGGPEIVFWGDDCPVPRAGHDWRCRSESTSSPESSE